MTRNSAWRGAIFEDFPETLANRHPQFIGAAKRVTDSISLVASFSTHIVAEARDTPMQEVDGPSLTEIARGLAMLPGFLTTDLETGRTLRDRVFGAGAIAVSAARLIANEALPVVTSPETWPDDVLDGGAADRQAQQADVCAPSVNPSARGIGFYQGDRL